MSKKGFGEYGIWQQEVGGHTIVKGPGVEKLTHREAEEIFGKGKNKVYFDPENKYISITPNDFAEPLKRRSRPLSSRH